MITNSAIIRRHLGLFRESITTSSQTTDRQLAYKQAVHRQRDASQLLSAAVDTSDCRVGNFVSTSLLLAAVVSLWSWIRRIQKSEFPLVMTMSSTGVM